MLTTEFGCSILVGCQGRVSIIYYNLGQEQANGPVVSLYIHNKVLTNAIIKNISIIVIILHFMFKGRTALHCHFINLFFRFQ